MTILERAKPLDGEEVQCMQLPIGAGIGLAESIYLGEEGRLRRTEQIVLVGQVPAEGASVKWALTRMEG